MFKYQEQHKHFFPDITTESGDLVLMQQKG